MTPHAYITGKSHMLVTSLVMYLYQTNELLKYLPESRPYKRVALREFLQSSGYEYPDSAYSNFCRSIYYTEKFDLQTFLYNRCLIFAQT